jgi:hypothetical protein
MGINHFHYLGVSWRRKLHNYKLSEIFCMWLIYMYMHPRCKLEVASFVRRPPRGNIVLNKTDLKKRSMTRFEPAIFWSLSPRSTDKRRCLMCSTNIMYRRNCGSTFYSTCSSATTGVYNVISSWQIRFGAVITTIP